jgi:hypothetical protein
MLASAISAAATSPSGRQRDNDRPEALTDRECKQRKPNDSGVEAPGPSGGSERQQQGHRLSGGAERRGAGRVVGGW